VESGKYGKYIMREPIIKGRFSPILHVCGEKHPERDCEGSLFPGFPAEFTSMCINQPYSMPAPLHAHDYDQLLFFIGGNPENIFDFGAEVELVLGDEQEKHLIDCTSIVYVPKGLMHCPLIFKKVVKPITFMHICFSPSYTRAKGEMTGHPVERPRYPAEEIARMKQH